MKRKKEQDGNNLNIHFAMFFCLWSPRTKVSAFMPNVHCRYRQLETCNHRCPFTFADTMGKDHA